MTAELGRRARAAPAHRVSGSAGLHPLTWAAWLGAGLTMVLLTSNPLYLALLGLSATAVYAASRPRGRSALDVLLVGGVALALLTIPLNLVTGSTGATTLFDLPAASLPRWLEGVTFGGPVTAESLTYAGTHAIAIASILALVCAFNAAVDHFKLLKYTPAGLAQLGIIVTIGLLLIPETLRRLQALRESRIVRGHATGLASVPGLLLPTLADALERSVQRAESLDARGFGRMGTPPSGAESVVAVGCVCACALAAFSYYYYPSQHVPSAGVLAFGLCGLVAVATRQATRSRATRLGHTRFSQVDGAIIGASIAATVCLVSARALAVGGVEYLPFPSIVLPQFHPLPAIACLLLLLPAGVSHEEARR